MIMTALRNILLALSIGVIMWMASCSNNGCEGNSSSLPLAGFYSSQTKTSIAIDSLAIRRLSATSRRPSRSICRLMSTLIARAL